MTEAYHQIYTRVPAEDSRGLYKLAQEEERSISYHVRLAIHEYLDRKDQEQLKREGEL